MTSKRWTIFALLLLVLMMPLQLLAQVRAVQGTVTSDDGPIIGATVRIKGKAAAGAVTDFDGRFTIQAQRGQTLVVSYVGYKNREAMVGNGPLTIHMTEDAGQLSEVVVVGYGTMKRSDLTGAVTSVGESALEKQASTRCCRVVLPCADSGQHRNAGWK